MIPFLETEDEDFLLWGSGLRDPVFRSQLWLRFKFPLAVGVDKKKKNTEEENKDTQLNSKACVPREDAWANENLSSE